MAVKRRATDSTSSSGSVVWNTENELKLFKAALKFKPAGVVKHFNMALIHHELIKSGMKDVTPAAIWEHLGQMYNLEAAEKIEKRALILEENECEFSLPKKDFHDAMNEMKKQDEAGDEPPPPKKSTATSETPKTGNKRPTRSTPGSGASSAKRRK